MFTVVETPTFQKQAVAIWSLEELHEFIDWIADNAQAGDVIPDADGARKVRWMVRGRGKRAGARVIYFNLSADEIVLLVAVYAKSDQGNMKPKDIKRS